MSCIISYWPPWFRKLLGPDGELPRNYCAVDLETSGYDHAKDVITQWGHCLVRDGEVVDRLSLIIDWTRHSIVPEHWVRSRMAALKQSMLQSGLSCPITVERMEAEGEKPTKALEFILDFTSKLQHQGVPFVAHNGTFDEKMICGNFRGFEIAPGFSFGDNGLIDTEALEKANQIPDNPRVHPVLNDTLRSYFHRVKYTRVAGLYSNMGHCYRKYELAKCGIPEHELHDARTDSYCCHLLLEKFRDLISETPLQPNAYPTADTKVARKELPRPATSSVPIVAGTRVRGQRNN